MDKKYGNLFSEGYLNGNRVKNRIVLSPMGCSLENPDGSISERFLSYYEARARGGAGIIIPGVACVDYEYGKAVHHQPRIDSVNYSKSWARMVDISHRYDALFFTQLHHSGNATRSAYIEGRQPVSASENPTLDGTLSRALTTDEVKQLIDKFIKAAQYSIMAGTDGTELHAGHTYIINQFLSPITNRREDEYGGSPENRARMLIEIVQGIKAIAPSRFIVGVRLAMEETRPGGSPILERQDVCRALEKAGASYISATIGLNAPDDFRMIETQQYEDGDRVYMAEAAKEVVNIPVFAVGKIREASMADEIIASGKADHVCLGRALIADPEWPNKMRSGNEHRVRHCVSCMQGCIMRGMDNKDFQCSVNPTLGLEYRIDETAPAREKKNIVVVGGGIGGMEAARAAALRGHKVTLVEKSDRLGGQINLSSVPPHKSVVRRIIPYYETELKINGVSLLMNTEATAGVVKALNPDKVIVATGATPIEDVINTSVPTVRAWDILNGEARMPKGKKIAVIGGGIAGCETAQYLHEQGNNEVKVFEMLPGIANGLLLYNMAALRVDFARRGIEAKVSTAIEKVDADGVHYTNEKEGQQTYKADVIVMAVGQKSVRGLAEELEAEGIPACYVGDAKDVAMMIQATRRAFFAGHDA